MKLAGIPSCTAGKRGVGIRPEGSGGQPFCFYMKVRKGWSSRMNVINRSLSNGAAEYCPGDPIYAKWNS